MPLEISKALNYLYLGSHWFKSSLRLLFSDFVVRRIFIVAAAVNLLAWLGAFLLARSIGDNLAVLHYNVVFGIDLIGPAFHLYAIPGIGTAIIAINILFAASLSGLRDRAISVIIATASALSNTIAISALYFAYFVNFS